MKFFTRRSLVSLPAVFAYLWITVTLCCIFPNLPIDDAYIHLQFIKNWALGYGLCFNPGEFSLGCTSYLYVAIMGTVMASAWEDSGRIAGSGDSDSRVRRCLRAWRSSDGLEVARPAGCASRLLGFWIAFFGDRAALYLNRRFGHGNHFFLIRGSCAAGLGG